MREEKKITELVNKHPGATIYIICSGSSMNYIDPKFFEGEIVIGVNNSYTKFPCTYSVMKHYEDAQRAIDAGQTLVISRYDCGDIDYDVNEFEGSYYYFDHHGNGNWEANFASLKEKDTNRLIVSESTVTSAMHLAALMGAKKIILCGHDNGLLDGKYSFDGYYDPPLENLDPAFWEWCNGFTDRTELNSINVRERLKELFGCFIYSLNPFLGIGLDKHKLDRHFSGIAPKS